jgi:hypothetical protein
MHTAQSRWSAAPAPAADGANTSRTRTETRRGIAVPRTELKGRCARSASDAGRPDRTLPQGLADPQYQYTSQRGQVAATDERPRRRPATAATMKVRACSGRSANEAGRRNRRRRSESMCRPRSQGFHSPPAVSAARSFRHPGDSDRPSHTAAGPRDRDAFAPLGVLNPDAALRSEAACPSGRPTTTRRRRTFRQTGRQQQ